MSAPATRIPQACEECRSHKTRCRRSDDPSRCHRCATLRLDCVPHIPNQRGAKAKRTIQHLNTRLIELQARLTAQPDARDHRTPVSEASHSTYATGTPSNASDGSLATQWMTWLGMEGVVLPVPETLSIVSFQDAALYLGLVPEMLPHFPFVHELTGSTMHNIEHRPFLALSLMVATSSSNPTVQDKLEKVWRAVLAHKVIVLGHKSLDLLQGLLVYLAWHHHYFQWQRQQTYSYMQLAIGMAMNLRVPSTEPVITGAAVHESMTVVGCYYLSCHVSSSLGKQQCFQEGRYLAQHAERLAASSHEMRDVAKTALSLSKIYEQVRDRDEVLTAECQSAVSCLQMDLHRLKLRSSQAKAWPVFAPIFHTMMYLLQRKLDRAQQSTDSSSARAHLHTLLDLSLSQPIDQWRFITSIEWGAMITAMILLLRSCRSSQDVTITLSYLDEFIDRLTQFQQTAHGPEAASELFKWFVTIVSELKKSLQRKQQHRMHRNDQSLHDTPAFEAAKELFDKQPQKFARSFGKTVGASANTGTTARKQSDSGTIASSFQSMGAAHSADENLMFEDETWPDFANVDYSWDSCMTDLPNIFG